MKIAIIGGGTGLSTLARGLRRLLGLSGKHQITAIVGMADSGGFTGILRNEKGVLPPGDIMKLLLAFSTRPELAEQLLYHRFADGSVPGHYILTGMAKRTGFLQAVENLQDLLQCAGTVLPATLDPAHLFAETNLRIIAGEGEIEKWIYNNEDWDKEKLLRVYLNPGCKLLPQASRAIEEADLVVIGPGSFYTSLVACLEVKGMNKVLAQKRIAYVVNVTNHPKETPSWTVSNFVSQLEQQIGRQVDVVVCNKTVPAHLLEKYGEEHSAPVAIDVSNTWNGRQVLKCQLVPPKSEFARHNPKRLARVILNLLE